MTDDSRRDSDRVIAMPGADGIAEQFPTIATVKAYWTALRGDRQMPARAEIDPRGLDGALSRCFILERLAPGIARFRLAGTLLNDLLGMEVRGMPLTALFLPDARKPVSEALEQVFDAPATAQLLLAGDRGIGKPPMDAAMLLLPLTSDLGEVTRILGCLPTLGPVGRTPRRFEVRQSRVVPIPAPARPAPELDGWPTRRDRALEGIAEEMAEPAADFAPRSAPRRQPRPAPTPPRSDRPHLYLVASNDPDDV